MELQVLAVPLCLLSGLFRFLPFEDFQAQVNHGLLIEFITVTLPFIIIVITHCAQRGSIFMFATLGLVIHLTCLMLNLKHLHSVTTEESTRMCTLVDLRTCFKLRERIQSCRCCGQEDEEQQAAKT